MYTIKTASHSLGNFYQVLFNDTIVAQFDSLIDAQEYIASKIKSDLSLDFTKTTSKTAQKQNVELPTMILNEKELRQVIKTVGA